MKQTVIDLQPAIENLCEKKKNMKKFLLILFMFCSFFAFGQTLEGVNEEHLVVSDTARIVKDTGTVKHTDTTLHTFPAINTTARPESNARSRRALRRSKRCSTVQLLLYGSIVYLANAVATTETGLDTSAVFRSRH